MTVGSRSGGGGLLGDGPMPWLMGEDLCRCRSRRSECAVPWTCLGVWVVLACSSGIVSQGSDGLVEHAIMLTRPVNTQFSLGGLVGRQDGGHGGLRQLTAGSQQLSCRCKCPSPCCPFRNTAGVRQLYVPFRRQWTWHRRGITH